MTSAAPMPFAVTETIPVPYAVRLLPALKAIHEDVWLSDAYLTTRRDELEHVSIALAIVAARVERAWGYANELVTGDLARMAREAQANAAAARAELERAS